MTPCTLPKRAAGPLRPFDLTHLAFDLFSHLAGWLRLLLLVLLLAHSATPRHGRRSPGSTGGAPGGGGPPQCAGLTDFLHTDGHDFLRRYHAHIDKHGALDGGKRCRIYQKLESRLHGYLTCPGLDAHWRQLVHHMDCSCSDTDDRQACIEGLECMEDELNGVLAGICDELHDFNLKQGTRHKCHFHREVIHCKEALVATSCGAKLGDLTRHLVTLQLVERRQGRHRRRKKGRQGAQCNLSPDQPHATSYRFEYSAQCPETLIEDLDRCSSAHLPEDNVVEFFAKNDMIPTANEEQIRTGCRAYTEYRECVRPVETTCAAGVRHVMSYVPTLRTYRLKMDRICDPLTIDAFVTNLPCYQRVVRSMTSETCASYFSQIHEYSSSVSAYTYYCRPDLGGTRNFTSELDRLIMCLTSRFQGTCGQTEGKVVNELLRDAFEDPKYLRLDYKPDCTLHLPTTQAPTSRPHGNAPTPQPHPDPALAHHPRDKTPTTAPTYFSDGAAVADPDTGTGSIRQGAHETKKPDIKIVQTPKPGMNTEVPRVGQRATGAAATLARGGWWWGVVCAVLTRGVWSVSSR